MLCMAYPDIERCVGRKFRRRRGLIENAANPLIEPMQPSVLELHKKLASGTSDKPW